MKEDDDLLPFLLEKGYVRTKREYFPESFGNEDIFFRNEQMGIHYSLDRGDEMLSIFRSAYENGLAVALNIIMVQLKAIDRFYIVPYPEQKQFLFKNYDAIVDLFSDANIKTTIKNREKIFWDYLNAP